MCRTILEQTKPGFYFPQSSIALTGDEELKLVKAPATCMQDFEVRKRVGPPFEGAQVNVLQNFARVGLGD